VIRTESEDGLAKVCTQLVSRGECVRFAPSMYCTPEAARVLQSAEASVIAVHRATAGKEAA
jgi:hypothetical protein